MSDIVEHKTNNLFPYFLVACIEKGIIDRQTAFSIDKIRKSSEIYSPIFNGTSPDPFLSFSSLIPCQENALALQLATLIANGEADPAKYNPIYICGASGIGKTHLLSAIVNESSCGNSLLFNIVDLESEYERAINSDNGAVFVRWLRSYDMLVIDDIQQCHENKRLQRELAVLIDRFTSSGRFFIASGDVQPEMLANIDSHLVSRLASGIQLGLKMGNFSERLEILKKTIEDETIPADVLDYMAHKIDDNVRSLKAVANQLMAMSLVLEDSLTVAHAETIIREREKIQAKPYHPPQVDQKPEIEEATKGNEVGQSKRRVVDQFKKMMDDAETEEEQALALQIALGERVRQLREDEKGDPQVLIKLERALELLREGKTEQAIRYVSI